MNLINAFQEYLGYAALAFFGSFLRANKWQREDGSVIWGKVLVEIPVAIAVGSVAIGVGEYYHLSGPIVGGLCGLLGLLGPAFFTSIGDVLITFLKTKLGGIK